MVKYRLVLTNNGQTDRYKIPYSGTIIMGRNPENGGLPINHQKLSRKHLALRSEGSKFYIQDLDSTNGTYLNGQKISPNTEYSIQLNDTVALLADGSISFKVIEKEYTSSSGSGNENYSNKALSSYLNQKPEVFIGRSSECDIIINDNSVSRKHARVFTKNGQTFIQDLNSTNGVFVNNKRIHRAVKVNASDQIFIGLHLFKLNKGQVDLSKEAAITTIDIEKTFSNGYKGLQATTIEIPYQKMVALMGPSGCGKSTLLKALNGDSPPSKGVVKVFGLDMAEHFEMLKHIIGYVPQENIVHADLTVQQSLYYAAKLRLSEDTTNEQIEQRITEVLESLKINTEVIRNTKVAQLSGGQRKRVSIAVEMLNRPKILFLDEPTSPLDPETIEEFLLCLKGLCKEGTTVIMVTHKPDDLNYVDRVIFMGVNGRVAYDGQQEQMAGYFNKNSLIHLYGLLSDPNESKRWYEKWRKKNAGEPSQSKTIQSKKLAVNPFRQVYWLSMRYLSIKVGNKKNLAIMLMQPVLIAILIMLAFDALFNVTTSPIDGSEIENPNLGILFLMAIAAIWFGVSNSAKEIVGEKDILKREYMYNMQLTNYLSSKLIILTLISAVQLLILQSLLYLRFSELTQFPLMWLYLMLISICSIQFGLLLSSFASSTEEVMSVLPIALMPQIILAGMIQPIENQITMFLSYFTLGRWGTEGIARIQDFSDEDQPFMGVLETHLYSEDVESIFPTDAMSANIIAVSILLVIMTAIIYGMLIKKLNPSN